jgi:hypothetical protein
VAAGSKWARADRERKTPAPDVTESARSSFQPGPIGVTYWSTIF